MTKCTTALALMYGLAAASVNTYGGDCRRPTGKGGPSKATKKRRKAQKNARRRNRR